MIEVAVIFIAASLIPILMLATYGVHLGIANQIELKAQARARYPMQMPIDPAALEEMQAEADKALQDIEQAQFNQLDDTLFQAGPIL